MSERHLQKRMKPRRPGRAGWSREHLPGLGLVVWRLWRFEGPKKYGVSVLLTLAEFTHGGRWVAAQRLRQARRALRFSPRPANGYPYPPVSQRSYF